MSNIFGNKGKFVQTIDAMFVKKEFEGLACVFAKKK